jgi:hypothetical protein
MLDDVNEKIRRNLLIFSATCLAIKWLDLSLVKILSSQVQWLNSPEPKSLLSMAVVVQVYLLLRYRFSPLASRAWREMTVEVMRVIRRIVRTDIKYKVGNFQFFKKSQLFKPNLAEYIQRELGDDTFGDGIPLTLRKMSPHAIRFGSSWKGEFACETLFDRPDGRILQKAGGYRLEFEYDLWSRILIWFKAAVPVLFYTRAAVELFFPIFIGLTSLLVLSIDLWMAM